MSKKLFCGAAVAFYVAATIMIFCGIWLATGGHFIYTVDDPYIHLSVAENIARGGYGINLSEYSSPSSSILFPFLLTPFALTPFGEFVPLVIGLIANGITAWMLAGFFFRYVASNDGLIASWSWLLVMPFLLFSINCFALPYVGMEHPLHVLAVVVTMTGLITMWESGRVTPAFMLAVVLAPLIRFEGLALSGMAILLLFWKGERRIAIALTLVLMACLAAYVAFMHAHGLPPLPSSVMAKSPVSAAMVENGSLPIVSRLSEGFYASLLNRRGVLLMVGILMLLPALGAFDRRASSTPASVAIALAAIPALAAHICFGQYGVWGRYEPYIITILLMAAFFARADAIKSISPLALRIVTCISVLLLFGIDYVRIAAKTPAASRGIYEQQYQMHRFATEYFPYRVAVNDIGLVSHRNDNYVLDLWGLGSEEARKLLILSGHRTPEAIAGLAQRSHVSFAMIYDGWFIGAVPRSWRLAAQLTTSKVTSAEPVVSFYLIDPAKTGEMATALSRFAKSLPPGASLVSYLRDKPHIGVSAPAPATPPPHAAPADGL